MECCGSFSFGLKYSPPSGHSRLTPFIPALKLFSTHHHLSPLFLHPSKFFPRFSQRLLAAFSVIHLSSKCSLNPSHVNPVTPGTCLDWQKAESCLTHVSRLLVYKPLKGTTNHVSHLFLCWLSLSFLCQPLVVTQDSLIQPLLDCHPFPCYIPSLLARSFSWETGSAKISTTVIYGMLQFYISSRLDQLRWVLRSRSQRG